MTDAPEHAPHHRPHQSGMAGAYLEFDVPAELHRLQAEATWQTGQNARTLVKYEDLRLVLIALQAKTRLPEHRTDGRLTVHVLSGHVQLRASGRTFNLRSGGIVALDRGVPHDVEALEESAVLLTIAWPGRAAATAQR